MAGFKRYISALPRSPLVEAATRLYESLTEPTMSLRKAYRNIGKSPPNPETPNFNETWNERHPYESAGDAFDHLMEYPGLAYHIVQDVLQHDPDGLASNYKDYHGYDFQEQDLIQIAETYPLTTCKAIYNDEYFLQSDSQSLDFNHTVVNGWLVHNTDHAWDIWNYGFQYGNDMGSLAYTNAGSTRGKEFGDYLFAFPIDDAPSPSYRDGMKYGNASVVFVGTGNEFWHSGDQENQVIFDRRQPTGCFIVDKDDDGNWGVFGKDMYKPVVRFEDYDDCLDWIQRNGYDYRKQMRMWNKATPGRQVASEKRWK
jgi:hypothetical protein